MIQLSRRSLLTGTVAASAASALTPLAGSTSFAAAPPVGKQKQLSLEFADETAADSGKGL